MSVAFVRRIECVANFLWLKTNAGNPSLHQARILPRRQRSIWAASTWKQNLPRDWPAVAGQRSERVSREQDRKPEIATNNNLPGSAIRGAPMLGIELAAISKTIERTRDDRMDEGQ